MFSLSTLAVGFLAVAGSYAAPLEARSVCLNAESAQKVASNYGALIANYTTALAVKSLTKNFTDYSESVNSLINTCPQGSAAVTLPLLSPTFSSRKEFIAGQGQQASINFNQLDLWYSCTSVTFRWESTNTAPITNPRPVVGIIVAEAIHEFGHWKIDEVFSEFDAAAWLQNLEEAGICATVNSSSPPIGGSTAAQATATSSGTATATANAAAATTSSSIDTAA